MPPGTRGRAGLSGWLYAAVVARVCGCFPRAILNIHPSLLPSFPGLDAQRQALDYGVAISGCTVHFVDDELDHGPIILQRAVPVLDRDDEISLSARILEQEHLAYPEAISRVLSQKYAIIGRRYLLLASQETTLDKDMR